MAHYYVIRHYSENNERKTPANYPYEDRAQAERQYNLLCAAAWLNEINKDDPTKNMNVDFESVEMGTVEQGAVRFSFSHYNTMEEIKIAVSALRELAQEE